MKKCIKKINIFMCCLLLCFCSVVAKPKEVQALIGVDDLALATIGLMGLSLLGIGITENINENYDTYKKVALNTYNSMCDFVGQSWEDMCLSAYNTGQFALTQLNNVKSNIQDWYNSYINANTFTGYDGTLSSLPTNTRFIESIYDIDIFDNTCTLSSKTITKIKTFQEYINSNNYEFLIYHIPPVDSSMGNYYIFYITDSSKHFHCYPYNSYGQPCLAMYSSNDFNSLSSTHPYYATLSYKQGVNNYFSSGNDDSSYNLYLNKLKSCIYTNARTFLYSEKPSISSSSLYFIYNGQKWIGSNGLDLGLPSSGSNPLDGFAKLNDMVKGLDGVLDLDPISIGALNGTFEITDTTITNYGSISTTVLDLSNVHDDTYTFPLTGSLENTLDDTHTMVFNPTLDEDITNVGDITVTYPQNPSIPTLKDVDKIENIDDLKFDWTTVFPFCIPFDFIKFLKVLCSDPITPEVNWNYDLVGFKGTLNLSLKDYNDVASLLRKMETFSFILFLIFKTRELIRG